MELAHSLSHKKILWMGFIFEMLNYCNVLYEKLINHSLSCSHLTRLAFTFLSIISHRIRQTHLTYWCLDSLTIYKAVTWELIVIIIHNFHHHHLEVAFQGTMRNLRVFFCRLKTHTCLAEMTLILLTMNIVTCCMRREIQST